MQVTSPDGKYIVAASNPIEIWDSETGELIRTLEGHNYHSDNVIYSPNSKYIAAVSYNIIKIWDSGSGELIRTLKGHTSRIDSANYSPAGRFIVSASDDKTIKIWDSETGESINTIYPMAYTKVLGADLRDIKHDDLTEIDILKLQQNGAIID